MRKVQIVRDQVLAKDIVMVDGMSKSGKSLILPLISSFSNGELPQFDHIFEYLATLYYFGKMDRQAAESLIKLYADFDLYNVMIGRNTNFRRTDDSSAFKNLLEKRQKARSVGPEGDIVVRKIQKRNPLLVLMVHYIFQANDIFFSALGERLKLYIMLLRHPALLVKAWDVRKWNERFNRNPRDFQICIDVNRKKVPWFAAEDPEYYLSLGSLERSIYVVHLFTENIERQYKRFSQAIKEKIMFVPFEPFVMNPIPYLKQISRKTRSQMSLFTHRMLKRVNLPRALDRTEINHKRDQINVALKKRKVSGQIQSMFDSLCERYEEKYLVEGCTP